MTTGRPNRGRKHETQPAFEQPLQLLAELHGRLQSQCGALERLQHQLAGAGAAAGRAGLPRPGEVEPLVSLLRSHLAQEDQELLPLAERLLSDDALADIGDGMRRRHHAG